MTVELTPCQERLLQEAVRQGRFLSINEALGQLVEQLARSTAVREAEPSNRSTQEAAARIRELSQSTRRPEGLTIRDMIDEGWN